MNNNNRGNNRRRGRSNNRPQGGGGSGGGQQLNRIDSRARGNAPQLLEKYRKLAHDAHLNGDRVTEEYNLQFADHYFRVIADTRVRQEEQRQPRTDRWQENGEGDRYDGDSAGDYGDAEYPASPYGYGERREPVPRNEERDEPAADQRGNDNRGNDSRANDNRGNDQRSNDNRANDNRGNDQRGNVPRGNEQRAEATDEGATDAGNASPYEPVENPFTRDNRAPRGPKPRRPRRETAPVAAEVSADAPAPVAAAAPAPAPAPARRESRKAPETLSLDLAVLPPAISAGRDTVEEAAPEAVEAKPKRRVTRRKPPADDADETLQAVS